MTDPRTCSRCGAPLPVGGGECPRCLLRLGLELPPRDPGGGSAATGRTAAPDPAAPPRRPVALPLDEVARRFPQLEIKALLGQGGMGVVYHARQPRLARDVALKLLPPEQSSDPSFAERFLREARAMARLAHPNIVAVHDFGETDGLCWLLMDYVDGVNLRQALRAGALPPEKALAIVPQMCDALQYAHDEGVVHRDIKPENVLVDRQGRVKIADFGLAKLVGPQDVTLTDDHQVFGTPHYMAPEQMEAARDVDHRADIFSLGVVFYEMLTGRLPVGRFEPPSRRVKVDVRLDDVVLHALEHEPERRYQHASEVKTDVESVVAGKEPKAARAAAEAPALGRATRGDDEEAAAGERGKMRLHNFAGLWLEWPRSQSRPRVAAGSGRTSGGTEGARPGRGFVWTVQAGWVALSMLIWATVAWRWAGELASNGRLGLLAGVALLVVTAWVYVQIGVHAAPKLRDALAAEVRGQKALRLAIGVPALVAGLLLLGYDEVESWERGVLHYVSTARSPQQLLGPTSEEGVAVTAKVGAGMMPILERREGSLYYKEGSRLISASQALVVGLLLLAAFGAVSVAGAPGQGRAAWIGPVLVVPFVLLAGLRLSEAWSDVNQEAEHWPALQVVSGTERLELGVDEAGAAIRRALELDGYQRHAEQQVLYVARGGKELARVLHLAFEPPAPWDRWDLEGGQPRRRRPHVALRFVGDADRCTVTWDCGQVRPVAGEDVAWRAWLERILRDAPRFAPTASGG